MDEKNIILVKEVGTARRYEELEKTANTILDMLNTEAMTKVRVAYGTIVDDIKEVSRSYKEAKMALDVGKIFYSNKNVVAYNNLGIGRLIYQLPHPAVPMFINEIFDGKSPDEFDEETLTTINKFFENSLNVSETSRQLYIHRNTLVYRLDKLAEEHRPGSAGIRGCHHLQDRADGSQVYELHGEPGLLREKQRGRVRIKHWGKRQERICAVQAQNQILSWLFS